MPPLRRGVRGAVAVQLSDGSGLRAYNTEPIKGQAVLVLTESGWMHAAMFGK